MKEEKSAGNASVGIDLGLKDFAALSTGEKIEAQRFYRDLEPKLAMAQRANKEDRTKAIHAKIANRRKDFLHKLSTRLVKEHSANFIGNVKAAGLVKTKMAKSIPVASWTSFRTMLHYKSECASVLFEQVDEAFSTQTCSACHNRTGPKGLEGLRMREWVCSACGTTHDHDRNSAKSILAAGHRRLEQFHPDRP